jgi:membrane protease subunit (stomatin/prohibitin family)
MFRRRGPGLIGTAVVVGGAAHMGAKSAQKSQAAAQQEAAPAAAAPAEPDYTAELEQLNQLKNQGIITEEEFEAKKKQVLGI